MSFQRISELFESFLATPLVTNCRCSWFKSAPMLQPELPVIMEMRRKKMGIVMSRRGDGVA